MKKTIAVALLMAVLITLLAGCGASDPMLLHQKQISKMAQFVNEKYGLTFTASDCTYFREEDYEWHGDRLGFGQQYEIPYVAIFEKDGKRITVTDRKGFISDDGQLPELNEWMCGYFEEMTGLDIAFVEVREISNGNIVDRTLNHILQYDFNARITEENIDDFMDKVFNCGRKLELLFYFREEADFASQREVITTKLKAVGSSTKVARVTFFTMDATQELEVYFSKPLMNEENIKNSSDDTTDPYKFGHYHVPNAYIHHYPEGSASRYQDVTFITILHGGAYSFTKSYSAGLGKYVTEEYNGWSIATYP